MFATFIWATGLGILPIITLTVVLSTKIYDLSGYAWLGIAIAGLALWLTASYVLARLTTWGRFAEQG